MYGLLTLKLDDAPAATSLPETATSHAMLLKNLHPSLDDIEQAYADHARECTHWPRPAEIAARARQIANRDYIEIESVPDDENTVRKGGTTIHEILKQMDYKMGAGEIPKPHGASWGLSVDLRERYWNERSESDPWCLWKQNARNEVLWALRTGNQKHIQERIELCPEKYRKKYEQEIMKHYGDRK